MFRIAELTTLDPDHVVGKLARIWLWVGSHTTNGTLDDTTLARIDIVVAQKGFGEAMESVGWVVVVDGAIRFPRWKDHNSKCAKKRLLGAKRAARKRNADALLASRGGGTKSAPTEQQSKAKSSESKEQSIAPASDIAMPDFAAMGDACSLLQSAGFDDGAINAIIAFPGVDHCKVQWACERTHAELRRAHQGKRKPIPSPNGYLRMLIERKPMPASYRAEWQKKRIEKQAASMRLTGATG